MSRVKKSVVLLVLVFSVFSILSLASFSFADGGSADVHPLVVSQLESEGKVSVIVMLKEEQIAPPVQVSADNRRGVSSESAAAEMRERQVQFLDAKRASARQAKEEFFENLPAPQAIAPAESPESIDGETAVSESSEVSESSQSSVPQESVKLLREYYSIGAVEVEVDEAGLEALRNNPAVAKVLPNLERRIDGERGTISQIISDLEVSLNESAKVVNSDAVANITVNTSNLTGHGEIVCVIDTGIDTSHLLFGPVVEASNIVGGIFGGYDFVNNDANATDDNNHGTHVSGIAVGNFSPYFGTARNAQVVPVKVCNAGGSCPDAAILAGVDYCNNNISGTTVISGSLGGGAPLNSSTCSADTLYPSLEPLLTTSLGLGIIPVFASGNNGCGAGCTTGVDYPACSPQVISVGSTTKADAISSFTDRGGDRFDIYAPGQSIVSSIPTFNAILSVSGTSQATPHVSGAIAVFQQNEKSQGRARINLSTMRQLLQQTGVPIAPNNSRLDMYAVIMKRNLNYSANATSFLIRNDSVNTSILFRNTTNFTGAIGCVDLAPNFAGVNSTGCPQYNKSAHVVLGGVSHPAVPYVDGALCPSTKCANITITSRGLEMDVQGFSNFTSVPGCPATINASTSLNQSISSNGTCITFGADNIELDCQGFIIQYANNSAGVGVNATGRQNVTVRNCQLHQGNSSVSSAAGVLFSATNTSLITNTTSNVSGDGSHGFRIASGSRNNTLQYSSAFGNSSIGDFGVYIATASYNNTVQHSSFSTNSTASSGIVIDGLSSNNTVYNNTAMSNISVAIIVDSASGNTLTNNRGLSDSSIGISIQNTGADQNVLQGNSGLSNASQGIRLIQASRNVLVNNTAQVTLTDSALVVMTGSNLNVLRNNTGVANSGPGIFLTSDSGNTTVVNNRGVSVSGAGIRVFSSINHTLTNNTGTSTSGYGIEINSASNNTLTNNTGTSDSSDGITVLLIAAGNNTLINNSGVSNTGNGISIGSSWNNTLYRNIGRSTGGAGLVIATALNNVLIENALTSVSADGLLLNVASGTNISASNASSTSFYGVRINGGANNIVLSSRATSQSEGGFYLTGGTTANAMSGNTFQSNSAGAIEWGGNSGQNNNFTNTTLQANGTWIKVEDINTNGNTFNNTLFDNGNGSIRIIGNFTLPNDKNITAFSLNTSLNRSFLNSTNLTFLNQSAQITLRGLTFSNARAMVDVNDTGNFSACDSSVCTSISYGAGTFIFNVTHFTAYASEESGGVSITKADSQDPVVKGAIFNYTITVNNSNNASIFNVTVNETYPQGISFVSAQPTPTGNSTFTIGTLAANTSFQINISVRAGSNLANGTILNNSARVVFAPSNGTNGSVNVSELTTIRGIPIISTNKIDSPDPVPRGTPLSYNITVTNNGDEITYNITVTEGYPANTNFITSVPAPTLGNNSFTIGNLTPGQSTTINITLNVSPSLANGSVLNNSYNLTLENLTGAIQTITNSTTTTVLGSPNISAVKTDTVDPVFAGDQFVYRITLNNTGDDTAFNITVTEGYPSGVSFVSAQPTPTGNNTFVISNLSPSAQFVINITLTVGANNLNGTLLNNTVNVSFANRTGQNGTTNASENTTVIQPPFLVVNKTVNQTTVVKGTTLNYTITVNNTGSTTAFNVTVLELYPTGVAFVSSQPTPTSGNGTFNVGNLLPNQSTTINLSINFSVTLVNATIKNNSLNITANRSDGRNITPQNTSAVATVLGFPQVSIVKSDTPDPVVNGTVLTYVITVTNGGDEIAYNVTVTEGYPANVTLLTTQPIPTPDNATFPIGNLLPGQTFLINITVNVSGSMVSGQLNNSVNVTFANASGASVTLQNNTLTTVIPPPVPFVPGGGGGGGGGGGAGVSTSQSMSGNTMTTNYLRAGDKVKFQISALEHTMTVLTVLNDRVNIRVASVPQEFIIKKGVVQAVDVTGDGKPDVRISVTDIAYSKALFYLEKAAFSPEVVREPTPAPAPAPVPVPTPTPTPAAEPTPAPQTQGEVPVPEFLREPLSEVVPQGNAKTGVSMSVMLLAGVLIIGAIVGAAVFYRKPPRSSDGESAQQQWQQQQFAPKKPAPQPRAAPPAVPQKSYSPSVASKLSVWWNSSSKPSDALAEARKIDEALKEMKKGMKESEHLAKKAEKLDRKGKKS